MSRLVDCIYLVQSTKFTVYRCLSGSNSMKSPCLACVLLSGCIKAPFIVPGFWPINLIYMHGIRIFVVISKCLLETSTSCISYSRLRPTKYVCLWLISISLCDPSLLRNMNLRNMIVGGLCFKANDRKLR